MQFDWTDLVGTVGVFIIISTYAMLQTERLKSESLQYSVLNAVGAGMIVFSLFFNFNLSAFIVEAVWILVSLFGIGKYFWKKNRKISQE